MKHFDVEKQSEIVNKHTQKIHLEEEKNGSINNNKPNEKHSLAIHSQHTHKIKDYRSFYHSTIYD